MKRSTIDILACPVCGKGVFLKTPLPRGGEIIEGTLSCSGCGRSYAVKDGIPRMLPTRK